MTVLITVYVITMLKLSTFLYALHLYRILDTMYIEFEGKNTYRYFIYFSLDIGTHFLLNKLLTKSRIFKPLYSGCNLLPMSSGSWNEAIKDEL